MNLADLFVRELQYKTTPTEALIKDFAKFPDTYPFDPEHAVVLECKPAMAFSILFM